MAGRSEEKGQPLERDEEKGGVHTFLIPASRVSLPKHPPCLDTLLPLGGTFFAFDTRIRSSRSDAPCRRSARHQQAMDSSASNSPAPQQHAPGQQHQQQPLLSAPDAQQDSSQASAQSQQHPSPLPPTLPSSASQPAPPGQAPDNDSLLPPQPVAPSAGPSTAAPSPAPPTTRSTRKAAPPIIAFDPSADGSDDDDDDDEGGPKKKRRAAAGPKASSAKGSGNEAGGSAGPVDPDDKGRRKIEIEYIQKKEKRHITFSKRKAGIMKKVRRASVCFGPYCRLRAFPVAGIRAGDFDRHRSAPARRLGDWHREFA